MRAAAILQKASFSQIFRTWIRSVIIMFSSFFLSNTVEELDGGNIENKNVADGCYIITLLSVQVLA